jgi:hypothetical protein
LSGLARPSLAKASSTRSDNYVRYIGSAFDVEFYLQTTMRTSALQAKLGSDTGAKRRPVHCELALLVTRLICIYVDLPFGLLFSSRTILASPHSPRFCFFCSSFLLWPGIFSTLPEFQKSVEQFPYDSSMSVAELL